jgi:hypothetical protein
MTPNVPECSNDSSSVSVVVDKQQPPFQFRPRAQSFREGGIVSRVVITNAVPQQTELFIQPAKRDLPTRKTLIDTFVERNDQYWVCVFISLLLFSICSKTVSTSRSTCHLPITRTLSVDRDATRKR